MINAGRLNERITLQQRTAGADALGQESTTWTDLDTVWAGVTSKRGREFFAAGAVQAEAAAVFRIRYRADVVAIGSGALRVVWNGQPYDVIEPPQDVDAQHVAIDLMCTTGARDGR